MIAIEQQHERVIEFTRAVHARGLLAMVDSTEVARGSNDVGFLLTAVRRFSRVVDLVRRSAIPEAARLREPIRLFESRVRAATPVRDFLEHFDEARIAGRTGIGYGIGPDIVTVTYAGEIVQTDLLLEAARDLHRAVRAVVDPLATADVHWRPCAIAPGGLTPSHAEVGVGTAGV